MMWECNFENEPVDFKLLGLRFLRKIWILFLGILLGVLLIGGGYFLKKVVLAPEKEYQVIAETYIDYVLAEGQPVETVCFNQATWASLVKTDVFTIDIADALKQEGWDITPKQVAESIEGTLLSDVRIVTTTVTTKDPELSVAMSHALQNALIRFGEEQKEIAGTRILTSPEEAELVIFDIRTMRAIILGGVAGGFLVLMIMLLYFTLDDSIYIPVTFERRYHIPMLGTLASKELTVQFTHLCKGCGIVAVTAIEEDIPIDEITKVLSEKGGPQIDGVGCVEEKPERIEELRKADGVILAVASGRHDGKRIEKVIEFLKKQDINICGALLWDADEDLIKRYYSIKMPRKKR